MSLYPMHAAVTLILCASLSVITACTGSSSRILPEKEEIIKIQSGSTTGIIAESRDTTYYFTDEKSKALVRIYGEFLADFKEDISGVRISFLQSRIEDSVYVTYLNEIPEEKIKHKYDLFQKYRKRSHTTGGITQVGFNTDGYFITQPNILSDQYRLAVPLEVNIRQVDQLAPRNDFQGIGTGILLPVLIPFMMIGCMAGPC